MRILLFILTLCFCGLPATADAAAPEQRDFALGFGISVPEDGFLYRIDLPDACLATGIAPGQQDMAVFNSGGALVPSTPWRPKTTLKSERARAVIVTTLQKREKAERGNSPDTVIIIGGQGDTATEFPQAPEPAPVVTGYLLSLPESGLRATALTVRWRADELTQIVRVRVEQAARLNAENWRVLADGPLAQLPGGADGSGLESLRFSLPGRGIGRYLRISFPELKSAPELLEVYAEVQREETPDYRLLELDLKSVGEAESGERRPAAVFEFDIKGRKWVSVLEIESRSPVIWRKVALLGRQSPGEAWQRLGSFDLFKIARGSGLDPATNGSVTIQAELPRYLRLEVPEGARGKSDLAVGLFYLQPGLVFQAQAPGPYTLACGSATARVGSDIDPALLGLSEPRMAMLHGESRVLGGEAALVPPAPEKETDRVRVILWIALGLGVAALAGMILALYRNMKKG